MVRAGAGEGTQASGGRHTDVPPARERALGTGRAAIVLVVLTVLSLPWLVHDHWDDRPDAARYLLAARSLADGEGYRVMGEPFRLRPPGFSLLLAPLVAWRGFDFLALNVFVNAFAIAAVLFFYLLMAPRVGPPVALAAALVVWLNPQLRALSNQVMSDMPALALALLALLAMRWANERPHLARDLAVAVAIVLATYVRTANVVLLLAFLAGRIFRRRSARAEEPASRFVLRLLVPSAVVLVLYLPWMVQPPFASPYDSPDLYSYKTAFLGRDPNNPRAPILRARELLDRVGRNTIGYVAALGSGGATRRMTPVAPVLAAIGMLALLVTLVRRRESPEWFAVGMLVVLLVYYVAATRLLLPVLVVTLGGFADAARWIGCRIAGRRIVDVVLVVGLAALAAVGVSTDAEHARRREHYDSLLGATRLLRDVPPAAPVGGDVGAVYALLLDRPVYSLRPISRRHRRRELFEALERRGFVAIVARREGPLAPVLQNIAREGKGQLATLSHHVVLRAERRVEGQSAADARGDSS